VNIEACYALITLAVDPQFNSTVGMSLVFGAGLEATHRTSYVLLDALILLKLLNNRRNTTGTIWTVRTVGQQVTARRIYIFDVIRAGLKVQTSCFHVHLDNPGFAKPFQKRPRSRPLLPCRVGTKIKL
jgi:hypothetical protein